MKKISLCLILLCCAGISFSQKVYFVYLQAEGAQPFFLKQGEKIYSSNSSGYLILSRLADSTYHYFLGFPQNKWPEQSFTFSMEGRDHGFLLKKGEGAGWDLMDLQSSAVIHSELASLARNQQVEAREVSPFTEALSKAANDPSLKQKVVTVPAPVPVPPVVKKEEKPASGMPQQLAPMADSAKPAPELATLASRDSSLAIGGLPDEAPLPENPPTVAKQDTVLTRVLPDRPVEKKPDVSGEKKIEPTLPEAAGSPQKAEERPVAKDGEAAPPLPAEYKASVVTRKTESSTSEGFGLTFVDEYPDGRRDTIQIFIPNPRAVFRDVPPPQEETVFLPMDSDSRDLTPAKKDTVAEGRLPACEAVASEAEFLRLRRRMVAAKSDEAMLEAAKKVFKTRCLTTGQIKSLGSLFLNDAGRYGFFDAAYLSVSDRANFPGLEAELKDPYYISRFKAMLR